MYESYRMILVRYSLNIRACDHKKPSQTSEPIFNAKCLFGSKNLWYTCNKIMKLIQTALKHKKLCF